MIVIAKPSCRSMNIVVMITIHFALPISLGKSLSLNRQNKIKR